MKKFLFLSLGFLALFSRLPGSAAGQATLSVSMSPNFTGCGGTSQPVIDSLFEQQLVSLVNQERSKSGVPPMKRVQELDEAARYHAADMQQDDYFDHNTFDRVSSALTLVCDTWARIRTFYPDPRAENIAWGYSTPSDVMNGWMNSSGHRANILSTNREIGVGYYLPGPYWVQDFGTRPGVYPLVINSDDSATASANVSLYIYGNWTTIRLRNNTGAWSSWQSFSNNIPWTLDSLYGLQTVEAEMSDGSSQVSSSDTIFLTAVGMEKKTYQPIILRGRDN